MMNKWNLDIGDLFVRGRDIGIVCKVTESAYGHIFQVHWVWPSEGQSGMTSIPEQLLCRAFFTKFKHIKGSAKR